MSDLVAIDAVPSNSATRSDIYIKSGLYDAEKLIVPADKINFSLIGESRTETIISYHMYDCSAGHCPVEDAALWSDEIMRTSATLTIIGDGFSAENLTLENTAGPVGQAQAVTVRGDKAVFINCDIKSYQDTLYFWNEGSPPHPPRKIRNTASCSMNASCPMPRVVRAAVMTAGRSPWEGPGTTTPR